MALSWLFTINDLGRRFYGAFGRIARKRRCIGRLHDTPGGINGGWEAWHEIITAQEFCSFDHIMERTGSSEFYSLISNNITWSTVSVS